MPAPTKIQKKQALGASAQAKVDNSKFNITDKALLCIITFKKAGNSKRVPKKLVKVDADEKMVKTSKALLESPELMAVRAFDTSVQEHLRKRALPSPFSGGIWLLPLSLVDSVDEKLTEFETERRVLVETFLQAYPDLREKAQEKLRSLFDEEDYPPTWKMRAQFSMAWRYVAFGVPNSLKEVKKAIFDREQEKAEGMWKEATGEIQNLLRANLAKLIGHIVDRLTPGKDGKTKKFQSTMLDNINDFLGVFDARNICDDTDLKKLVDQAKTLVNGVEAGKLRDDKELREKINAGFTGIKTELDLIVVAKSDRKVKVQKGGEDEDEETGGTPAGSGNFSDAAPGTKSLDTVVAESKAAAPGKSAELDAMSASIKKNLGAAGATDIQFAPPE